MNGHHNHDDDHDNGARRTYSLEEVEAVAKKLGVNTMAISIELLRQGMNVELEHIYNDRRTDLLDDEPDWEKGAIVTAKIALAHLMENPGSFEFPHYYTLLARMEELGENYWKTARHKNISKPPVFLPDPNGPKPLTLSSILMDSEWK